MGKTKLKYIQQIYFLNLLQSSPPEGEELSESSKLG